MSFLDARKFVAATTAAGPPNNLLLIQLQQDLLGVQTYMTYPETTNVRFSPYHKHCFLYAELRTPLI